MCSMGKPYESELREFPETLRVAAAMDLQHVESLMLALGSTDLLAIGSGGSFTSAVPAPLQ